MIKKTFVYKQFVKQNKVHMYMWIVHFFNPKDIIIINPIRRSIYQSSPDLGVKEWNVAMVSVLTCVGP